jgi:hypothetical protein
MSVSQTGALGGLRRSGDISLSNIEWGNVIQLAKYYRPLIKNERTDLNSQVLNAEGCHGSQFLPRDARFRPIWPVRRKRSTVASLSPDNLWDGGSIIVGEFVGAVGKPSPNNRAEGLALNRDLPGQPRFKYQAESSSDPDPYVEFPPWSRQVSPRPQTGKLLRPNRPSTDFTSTSCLVPQRLNVPPLSILPA